MTARIYVRMGNALRRQGSACGGEVVIALAWLGAGLWALLLGCWIGGGL